MRPPAPSPWSARNRISWIIVCERPESIDPARKITIAAMNTGLRPSMSPSLP
jgi:hypothetical protein